MRQWTCLILEPNNDTNGQPHGLVVRRTVSLARLQSGPAGCAPAAAQAEIARLLAVTGERTGAIKMRSKVKCRASEMEVYINDYRDATTVEEMALGHALPRNFAAHAILAPLGYHTIMPGVGHFRGRIVVTGPGGQSILGPVEDVLQRRWQAYAQSDEARRRALLAATTPSPPPRVQTVQTRE